MQNRHDKLAKATYKRVTPIWGPWIIKTIQKRFRKVFESNEKPWLLLNTLVCGYWSTKSPPVERSSDLVHSDWSALVFFCKITMSYPPHCLVWALPQLCRYNSIVGASISFRGAHGIIYDTRSSGYSKCQGSDQWSFFMRVIFTDFARKKLKIGQEFPKQHTVSHGGPGGYPFYTFKRYWNGSPTYSSSSVIFLLLFSLGRLLFLAFRNKFPEVLFILRALFLWCKAQTCGGKKWLSALSLSLWSFIFFGNSLLSGFGGTAVFSDLCICLWIVFIFISTINCYMKHVFKAASHSLPSEPSQNTCPLPIKCLIQAVCAALWMNWTVELD